MNTEYSFLFFATITTFASIPMSPLSAIYWLITSIRNWCYDEGIFKSTSFDIPIISVGNLAVGGTGKTPMVEFLVNELEDDYSIAVLSRGYGRKTKGFRWVNTSDSAKDSGDEPLQVKNKFTEINVAVCEDRVAGVRRILNEEPQTSLIILDDAFQHRAIKPQVQLLLSRYSKPYFMDYLMPSGRLRESRKGVKRADAVLFTKCPAEYKSYEFIKKPTFYSSISYATLDINEPVYGFSGLADNTLFARYLGKTYDVQGFSGFQDHHDFTQSDLDNLLQKSANAQLVCTEKDWVKIQSLQGSERVKHIPITIDVSGEVDFISWLKKRIHES